MEQSFSNQDAGNPLLTRVHEGMKVYDQGDNEIGTVETVFFGELTAEEDQTGTGPATASVDDLTGEPESIVDFAFGGFSDVGESGETDLLRSRLLREGYVKIDTGMLSSDVYILPDQIAQVTGEKVQLKVARDDLIES